MKIAVLADIHGNNIALKKVLDEAKTAGVERLFILGDVVGYYYHPDEAINLLDSWPKDMIIGNHEMMLKKAMKSKKEAERIRAKYGSGIDFALKKLSKPWLKKLTKLPITKIKSIDGVRFKLCHGSPWDSDFYIYPDSPKEIMDKCILQGIDFVLIGHSHYPFVYKKNNTTLINSGSVGQSREEGGYANWILIDTSDKSFALKKTRYDSSEIIKEVKKTDPKIKYLYQVILRSPKGGK